jgi:hypothetical protein
MKSIKVDSAQQGSQAIAPSETPTGAVLRHAPLRFNMLISGGSLVIALSRDNESIRL